MNDTIRGYRIDLDGLHAPAELAVPVGDSIRATIGCDVFEVIRLADHVDMFVDEESLLKPEPRINWLATRIVEAFFPGDDVSFVYGNVVIVGLDHTSGETIDLDDNTIRDLEGLLP